MFPRVNVYIHLLTNIDRQVAAMESVDHLQHARVDAFGAVAGERCLRQDVRLESNKFER